MSGGRRQHEMGIMTRIENELRVYCGENSHPQYPLLRVNYTPSSRYPAGDFTPWIAKKLTDKQFQDIASLVEQLTRANPGLGIGDGSDYWAKYAIELCHLNLREVVVLDDEGGYLDLQSALFPYVLHGALDGFIIMGNEVNYLARAVSPYRFSVRNLEARVKAANEFVERMRQETENSSTAWTDFPLFDIKKLNSVLTEEVMPAHDLRARLREASIGARQLFFGTLEEGVGQGGWFARPYGINEELASAELAGLGLGELQSDPDLVLMTYRKEELLTALSGHPTKHGWQKKHIINYMRENAAQVIETLTKGKRVLAVEQDFLEEGTRLLDWVGKIREPLAIALGFR